MDSDAIGGSESASPAASGGLERRYRALVVGSGFRVQNDFLPALRCLDSDIEVVGIHSRTFDNARRVAGQWGVSVVRDLRDVRPGDVDVVLMSVTAVNNMAVLKALSHLAPGASLVIDTPGLGRPDDLARLSEYRRWANIRIAEDFMNMPQYRLVFDLIESGRLGRVSRITMAQMGYRYHALALVRSWLGFDSPTSARHRRGSGGGVDIEYRFSEKRSAAINEPYRQAEGSFSVLGSKARLVGHPMGSECGIDTSDVDTAVPCGRLARVEDSSGLTGFRIDGLDYPTEIRLPHHTALRAMEFEDQSEFNLLRIDGLTKVISSLWNPDPLNGRYRVEDGMADLLVSWTARYLPRLAPIQLLSRALS